MDEIIDGLHEIRKFADVLERATMSQIPLSLRRRTAVEVLYQAIRDRVYRIEVELANGVK